jgi:uncharacterized protein
MRAPLAMFDAVAFWRTVIALGLGGLTGWIAVMIGLPLPWMLGPMVGVAIAALAGAPIRGPGLLRPIVVPVIGVMLGSSITPDILQALGKWSVTVAFLIPFLFALAGVSYAIYRGIGRYDPVTAWFSAMPGGLNDMLVMGAEAGGVERKIALAHASRVFLVIVFVVLFFGLFLGVTTSGDNGNWVSLAELTLMDWVILGLCAALGVPMGNLVRLPAAQVFGPMILSGIAHVTGIVTVAPPSVIVILAQLVIGTIVGSRFMGAALRDVGRDLLLGIASSVSMLTVAVGFAWAVHHVTALAMTQTFLAFSPGGLAEMSLLAIAMGTDVAFVSVMHVVRLTLVIGAAAPLFRLMNRR